MNLITLHRWDQMPEYLVAEFQQHSQRWCLLGADDLEAAIQEVASIAGLDAEFRDAQGEEWDILVPERTQFHHFPDWDVGDRWLKLIMLRS